MHIERIELLQAAQNFASNSLEHVLKLNTFWVITPVIKMSFEKDDVDIPLLRQFM